MYTCPKQIRSMSVKHLDTLIDQKLKWDTHIEHFLISTHYLKKQVISFICKYNLIGFKNQRSTQ